MIHKLNAKDQLLAQAERCFGLPNARGSEWCFTVRTKGSKRVLSCPTRELACEWRRNFIAALVLLRMGVPQAVVLITLAEVLEADPNAAFDGTAGELLDRALLALWKPKPSGQRPQ